MKRLLIYLRIFIYSLIFIQLVVISVLAINFSVYDKKEALDVQKVPKINFDSTKIDSVPIESDVESQVTDDTSPENDINPAPSPSNPIPNTLTNASLPAVPLELDGLYVNEFFPGLEIKYNTSWQFSTYNEKSYLGTLLLERFILLEKQGLILLIHTTPSDGSTCSLNTNPDALAKINDKLKLFLADAVLSPEPLVYPGRDIAHLEYGIVPGCREDMSILSTIPASGLSSVVTPQTLENLLRGQASIVFDINIWLIGSLDINSPLVLEANQIISQSIFPILEL